MTKHRIDNSELTLDLIPEIDAAIEEISSFALTFSGYFYTGTMEESGRNYRQIKEEFLNSGSVSGSLSELRSALFWEQRQAYNLGQSMNKEFSSELIKHIRSALLSKFS